MKGQNLWMHLQDLVISRGSIERMSHWEDECNLIRHTGRVHELNIQICPHDCGHRRGSTSPQQNGNLELLPPGRLHPPGHNDWEYQDYNICNDRDGYIPHEQRSLTAAARISARHLPSFSHFEVVPVC